MSIIRLSTPATFPAAYQETCEQFLAAYWDGRRWEMEQEFGVNDLPISVPSSEILERDLPDGLPEPIHLASTFFAEALAYIAKAAAGELPRDPAIVDEVYEACQSLAECLFAVPGLGASYTIPQEFWQTPLGQMVARAFVWLEGDELITITEAARISGLKLSSLVSRIDRGKIRSYPDPSAANPQRGGRLVRRSDIEALTKP